MELLKITQRHDVCVGWVGCIGGGEEAYLASATVGLATTQSLPESWENTSVGIKGSTSSLSPQFLAPSLIFSLTLLCHCLPLLPPTLIHLASLLLFSVSLHPTALLLSFPLLSFPLLPAPLP